VPQPQVKPALPEMINCLMDKALAKRVSCVTQAETWVFMEEYLQGELDRAYRRFENAREPHEFYSVQSEVKVLKKLLNTKEYIRQSLEN